MSSARIVGTATPLATTATGIQEPKVPIRCGAGADLRNAWALAAVSSEALENISVAVTARAIRPQQRIVLRAGGGDDIVNESRSLFRIGAVCDITRITGALVACHTLDVTPITVFAINTTTYALFPDKRIVDLVEWNDNVDDRSAHVPQDHRTSDLRP